MEYLKIELASATGVFERARIIARMKQLKAQYPHLWPEKQEVKECQGSKTVNVPECPENVPDIVRNSRRCIRCGKTIGGNSNKRTCSEACKKYINRHK